MHDTISTSSSRLKASLQGETVRCLLDLEFQRSKCSRIMSIFAPEHATETLDILESPWSSLRQLPCIAQLPLALFMAIYCPLAFALGFMWELCWRMPCRWLYQTRHPQANDERWFWEAMVRSSPRRRLWLVLLRNELLAPSSDKCASAPEPKLSMARRLSNSTRSFTSKVTSKKQDDTDALHLETQV